MTRSGVAEGQHDVRWGVNGYARAVLGVVILLSVAACDWRGFEHEKKVRAARQGAAESQAAVEQDAFDRLCARDAAACWDKLVRASHRSVLGPAPGTTGVTQVCCEVPATDVSSDHSTPSGFQLATGGGSLQLLISPGVQRITTTNSTVRSQPAQVIVRPGAPHETVRWTEAGVSYIAVSDGLTDEQTKAALAALTLHHKP